MTTFDQLNDKQIMALTIYGEARGEPEEGKIAVGSVILERVKQGGWFGHSIGEVCLKPYQFSCYLPNDPNYPKLCHIAEMWDFKIAQDEALKECFDVASGLIDGTIQPNIRATHYETFVTHASWEKSMTLVATIGTQRFYIQG